MTDSTEAALLAAISAAPADDAPRLVYADSLIARGDPRGTYIQLQCAPLTTVDDRTRNRIGREESDLHARHHGEWLAPLRSAVPDVPSYSVDFVRGFPETIRLRVRELHALPRMCALEPTLRGVGIWLEGVDVVGGELDHVAAAGVSRLYFLGRSSDDVVGAVVAAPWTHLRDLALDWLDDARIARLAKTPRLAALTRFSLQSDRVTFDGMHTLAHAPWRLLELYLERTAVDAPALATLATGPAFRSLRSLTITQTALNHELASFAALPELRSLKLHGNRLDAVGLADVLAAIAAPIEHLSLAGNPLGDAGAHVLAASAKLATLRTLDITRTKFELAGLAALARSPHLAKLEVLYAHHDAWTRDMATAVARAPFRTSRRA